MAKKPTKKNNKGAPPVPTQVDNSWATKYRPQTIADMTLRPAMRKRLEAFVKAPPQSGCYLICAPTGTGKTTLARILAKAVTGGAAEDIIEHDAGTKTKIDDIRDLISESKFLPRSAKFGRAIVIDEVHALTGQAESAILKATEGRASSVVWILVTDRPQALDATLVGRCVKINLEPPPKEEVIQRLLVILEKESKAMKWQAKSLLALATACHDEAGNNTRQAIALLQEAVETVQANGWKNYADAVKGGLKVAPSTKAEVKAAEELIAGLMVPGGLISVIARLRGADPDFVINAIQESALKGVYDKNIKDDYRFQCVRATAACIKYKDGAARPGQSPSDRLSRMIATLAAMSTG